MIKIRFWGGPACGETQGWRGDSDWFRVIIRPRPSFEDSRETIIQTSDYKRSTYTDSTGLRVFLFPNAGKWLIEHWNESVANYLMNSGRHAKVLVVPMRVWQDAEDFIVRDMPSQSMAIQFDHLDGRRFRGIKIVFGDKTEFLAEEPKPPMSRGFGQSESPFDWIERRMVEAFQTPVQERREECGLSPVPVCPIGDRRNRTTIYSNPNDRRGPSMFRLVIEDGPKKTPERADRLHKQYLQAVTNWKLQYLENADRL